MTTETGWCIEHRDSPASRPLYLYATRGSFSGWDWSDDHLTAVRFTRREDAEAVAAAHFPVTSHRIAEHAWDDGRA